MMTNLFSIFDPSTSAASSLNWFSLMLYLSFIPLAYWVSPSRVTMIFTKMSTYIYSEFTPLAKTSPQIVALIYSLFIFILLNNLPGLLPYVYTSTAHLSVSLPLALSLWVGLMSYALAFNMTNLLVHLIPNGTPTLLMPFMVLVETISNIIRPMTLAIRLAANMIAGHLLISLLTSVTPLAPASIYPALLLSQMMLSMLEIAVAMIQAYVFSVLMTLYSSEMTN